MNNLYKVYWVTLFANMKNPGFRLLLVLIAAFLFLWSMLLGYTFKQNESLYNYMHLPVQQTMYYYVFGFYTVLSIGISLVPFLMQKIEIESNTNNKMLYLPASFQNIFYARISIVVQLMILYWLIYSIFVAFSHELFLDLTVADLFVKSMRYYLSYSVIPVLIYISNIFVIVLISFFVNQVMWGAVLLMLLFLTSIVKSSFTLPYAYSFQVLNRTHTIMQFPASFLKQEMHDFMMCAYLISASLVLAVALIIRYKR